jgi:hypothetical protein
MDEIPSSLPKRGRPTKFNDRLREKILKLCREGKTDEEIAVSVGISPRTLDNYKANHPDLLRSMEEAKSPVDDLVEASLFSRAVGYSHRATKLFLVTVRRTEIDQDTGQKFVTETQEVLEHEYEEHYAPDVRAQQFWLRNRQGKRWRKEEQAAKDMPATFSLGYKL